MSNTSERAVELYKTAREQQSKFTYFVLGLTAASLGFAVHTTRDTKLTTDHSILGVAVACWLFSLFAGLRYLEKGTVATHINYEYLQFRVDVASGQLPDSQAAAAVNERLSKASRVAAEHAGVWGVRQIRFLYAGTITFIAWHVVRMAGT